MRCGSGLELELEMELELERGGGGEAGPLKDQPVTLSRLCIVPGFRRRTVLRLLGHTSESPWGSFSISIPRPGTSQQAFAHHQLGVAPLPLAPCSLLLCYLLPCHSLSFLRPMPADSSTADPCPAVAVPDTLSGDIWGYGSLPTQ